MLFMDEKMYKLLLIISLYFANSALYAIDSYPCLIEPDETVDLGSAIIGVVKTIKVERGDDVKKGQIIAELQGEVEARSVDLARDRAKDSAAIQSAVAASNHAKRELQRANLMFKQKLVSKQFFDQAQTESKIADSNLQQVKNQQSQAKKELKLAQSRLDRSRIKSPFNGIITERYVSVGQRIQNQPLVKIVKVDPLRVEVIVPAAEFNRFKIGDILLVAPQISGVEETKAHVSIIDPIIDSASNSFRITLTLPNEEWLIPAGAKCEVRVPGENQPQDKKLLSAQSTKTSH